MTTHRAIPPMLAICTVLLTLTALYVAESVIAPVAFALFTIAIVWPLQRALQKLLPAMLALLLTLVVTITVVAALGWLIVWAFGTVGQWALDNAGRMQLLYQHTAQLLEERGLYAAGRLAESFDLMWLIRTLGDVAGRLRIMITFTLITLVFVILGLLEVPAAARKLTKLGPSAIGHTALAAGGEIARKFQRYMLVRSLMSVLTGIAVWGFASLAGLELAREWGVIAFVLNYIPVIGPFVATALPTLFAIIQFESWQMAATIFLCLNIIQFLSGSYIEPLIAGAALSVSPFMVLFAVFFWSFLWGIPGAFIGVPILIACVTVLEQMPSIRWLAILMSGQSTDSR